MIGLLVVFLTSNLLNAEEFALPENSCCDSIKQYISKNEGDFPFISDMSFRKFATHRIDQTTKFFDPKCVLQGDTIYLSDCYFSWFFQIIHPLIEHPYILISSDSDRTHPFVSCKKERNQIDYESACTAIYDSKVAFWFCKNMMLSNHPKIRQIPIGQNTLLWGDFPSKDRLLSDLYKDHNNKKNLLYLNLQLATHPTRAYVAQLFQDENYCFSTIKRLTQAPISREQFYEDLSGSIFTVAPPGYGPDIVRFWESILFNCIPIVKHSELDELYSELPVLFVHEWDQINEAFLIQNQQEIIGKNFSKEKALFNYWAEAIDTVQLKVREDPLFFSKLSQTSFDSTTAEVLASLLTELRGDFHRLFYQGAATGLRPDELGDKLDWLSQIYVCDPWRLPSLVQSQKIKGVTSSGFYSKAHVFLDLTHLKHTLSSDLYYFFIKASRGTLVCGNRGEDEYVRDVLADFSKKAQLNVNFKSGIWFFTL